MTNEDVIKVARLTANTLGADPLTEAEEAFILDLFLKDLEDDMWYEHAEKMR